MNRMYQIKKYIMDKTLYTPNGPAVSLERIIQLFCDYLDENKIVYGEGEFHRLADDDETVIDEKR